MKELQQKNMLSKVRQNQRVVNISVNVENAILVRLHAQY